MILTPQEQRVTDAVSNLDAGLQRKVAQIFGANGFDISLLATANDRKKLRDWVESRINETSPDVPVGLLSLRIELRQLRTSKSGFYND